ncbi:hypothetical protein TNCV_2450091 [Trichonephila clavipes]|nr:hypothetical protein TNCV_2450091 [Trichonephila clavipes]
MPVSFIPGVMRHVGEALVNERTPRLRGRVLAIGIAPWGIIDNRTDLIGKNETDLKGMWGCLRSTDSIAGEAVSLHSLLLNRNCKIYRQNFEADDFPCGAVNLYKVLRTVTLCFSGQSFLTWSLMTEGGTVVVVAVTELHETLCFTQPQESSLRLDVSVLILQEVDTRS